MKCALQYLDSAGQQQFCTLHCLMMNGLRDDRKTPRHSCCYMCPAQPITLQTHAWQQHCTVSKARSPSSCLLQLFSVGKAAALALESFGEGPLKGQSSDHTAHGWHPAQSLHCTIRLLSWLLKTTAHRQLVSTSFYGEQHRTCQLLLKSLSAPKAVQTEECSALHKSYKHCRQALHPCRREWKISLLTGRYWPACARLGSSVLRLKCCLESRVACALGIAANHLQTRTTSVTVSELQKLLAWPANQQCP